jgi:8-oxo-dGTP diphosphatase
MNLRHATRGLVLDPSDRLLLLRCELPGKSFWVAPGGGLEAGESHHEALARELREEIGLESADIQQHVWRQEAVGPYAAGHDGVRNDYYVVRTSHFIPEPTADWELEGVSDCHWWTLDELLAADAEFSPLALPTLIQALLTEGVPTRPILMGV